MPMKSQIQIETISTRFLQHGMPTEIKEKGIAEELEENAMR